MSDKSIRIVDVSKSNGFEAERGFILDIKVQYVVNDGYVTKHELIYNAHSGFSLEYLIKNIKQKILDSLGFNTEIDMTYAEDRIRSIINDYSDVRCVKKLTQKKQVYEKSLEFVTDEPYFYDIQFDKIRLNNLTLKFFVTYYGEQKIVQSSVMILERSSHKILESVLYKIVKQPKQNYAFTEDTYKSLTSAIGKLGKNKLLHSMIKSQIDPLLDIDRTMKLVGFNDM